ncbi:helix-turn-helix domain-containing protein [Niallia sp. BSM11]|uniref:helix-turn-helix domain-containing protein n=1 Tax=Niallia sp. BSM11 TaxID=3391576 RepID=UPI003984A870
MNELNLIFIKKQRLNLDLTLQEMANFLGFKNASTYLKYENGDYLFKAQHLPTLAEVLNCKIDNFF